MKLTNRSLKLAGVLSLALIGASPMALSTAVTAAPYHPVATQQHGGIDIGHKADVQIARNDRDGRGGYNNNDRNDRDNVGRNDRDHNRYGYDDRRYGDRFHKPPPKFEHVGRPHFAKHFHPGHWNFKFGHWTWVGGYWSR